MNEVGAFDRLMVSKVISLKNEDSDFISSCWLAHILIDIHSSQLFIKGIRYWGSVNFVHLPWWIAKVVPLYKHFTTGYSVLLDRISASL